MRKSSLIKSISILILCAGLALGGIGCSPREEAKVGREQEEQPKGGRVREEPSKEKQKQEELTEEEKQKKEKEEAEARRKAEEEAKARRRAKAKKRRKMKKLKDQARAVLAPLEAVNSDEIVLEYSREAAQVAKEMKKEIRKHRKKLKKKPAQLAKGALRVLKKGEDSADALIRMAEIDDLLEQIYDVESDSAAMGTPKNDKIFRDVQKEMWKLPPGAYPGKEKIYERAVASISKAWEYTNDEWNYETSTLRVSVQPKKTAYTKYWVCHIQTFSTDQMRSALSGGTYGNPRTRTSQEVAAHNGVIGINGSGFDYGSGIPAPGKSMIKEGKVYSDIYSNGNIMCVTRDGGMFTAEAGMTTEEMLSRGVRDTYCFGPTLVENGKKYEITSAFQQTYRYQRTAIGMVSPGDYYIVVTDGKGAGGSEGMTYEELQKTFLKLGCKYAYNLDGGGSTTLVFKGRVINTLTDGGGERPCADILYFIDAGDGREGEEIVIHEGEAMLKPPSSK